MTLLIKPTLKVFRASQQYRISIKQVHSKELFNSRRKVSRSPQIQGSRQTLYLLKHFFLALLLPFKREKYPAWQFTLSEAMKDEAAKELLRSEIKKFDGLCLDLDGTLTYSKMSGFVRPSWLPSWLKHHNYFREEYFQKEIIDFLEMCREEKKQIKITTDNNNQKYLAALKAELTRKLGKKLNEDIFAVSLEKGLENILDWSGNHLQIDICCNVQKGSYKAPNDLTNTKEILVIGDNVLSDLPFAKALKWKVLLLKSLRKPNLLFGPKPLEGESLSAVLESVMPTTLHLRLLKAGTKYTESLSDAIR